MSFSIFSLYQHPLSVLIAERFKTRLSVCTQHVFPDGETLIKIDETISDRKVVLIDSLDNTNQKLLPLLFLARTVKDLGASEVGLLAPYLGYMRQDKQFHAGEGLTSKYFAEIISRHFDWMITVDPHLHRYHDLSDIYTIHSLVVHAATAIAEWIDKNVENPVLIGPDSESEQWVKDIAQQINAPYFILEKERYSDETVKVNLPNVDRYKNHSPVLIDDIISSGHTLQEAVHQVNAHQMRKPVCVAVHPVFAGDAYERLLASPIDRMVSCNTIPHESNAIDVSELLIQALKRVYS